MRDIAKGFAIGLSMLIGIVLISAFIYWLANDANAYVEEKKMKYTVQDAVDRILSQRWDRENDDMKRRPMKDEGIVNEKKK